MKSSGNPGLSARPGQAAANTRADLAEAPSALAQRIGAAIEGAGGWIGFDRFMSMALYEPALGYYAAGAAVFGPSPADGSDFITAPELSPAFGQAVARQIGQILDVAQAGQVVEFGAGTGALAAQLLQALGDRIRRYSIVELSASLRQRQAARLQAWAHKVQWLDHWPEDIEGAVLGNEVLDAMPVTLLAWDGQSWSERGVTLDDNGAFAFADRPSSLSPPVRQAWVPGTVIEIHPQAETFVRDLVQRLRRGAALLIDYGFPEAEYYHPQRVGGTLMCHQAHRADSNPLVDVGLKDITAHVNFTGVALAAQDAGAQVLGYTSQARFLVNCGLPQLLQGADYPSLARAQKLLAEHEMGELFKAILLAREVDFEPLGFSQGDRSHRL